MAKCKLFTLLGAHKVEIELLKDNTVSLDDADAFKDFTTKVIYSYLVDTIFKLHTLLIMLMMFSQLYEKIV